MRASSSKAKRRTFFERQWAAEVYFSVSRYPTFHYENSFEAFNGKATHYGFAVVLKKCLLPESESFIPWIGIGAGYGQLSVVSGAGKIDGFEGLVQLELEQRIRGNISIHAEGVWSPPFSEERYSSPFLEGVNQDVIYDSDENPLNDAFSAFEFRIGVKIWLRPPKQY